MVHLYTKPKELMIISTDKRKYKRYKSLLKLERKIPIPMFGMSKRDIFLTLNEL